MVYGVGGVVGWYMEWEGQLGGIWSGRGSGVVYGVG